MMRQKYSKNKIPLNLSFDYAQDRLFFKVRDYKGGTGFPIRSGMTW